MRQILNTPSGTVDENYLYAVGVLVKGLLDDLQLGESDEKLSALLRGLYSSHNAGALHTAALNLKDMDREDGRSPLQKLYDLRVINEKVVAQVIPAEVDSASN